MIVYDNMLAEEKIETIITTMTREITEIIMMIVTTGLLDSRMTEHIDP